MAAGKEITDTAVALGLFDGVHKGHRAVLEAAALYAEKNGLVPAVCSFAGDTVSTKGKAYRPIYTDSAKETLLKNARAEMVCLLDFGRVRDMQPHEFVKEILIGYFGARCVFCGEDFRFGKNASGDVKTLEKLCDEHGAKLVTVPPVMAENGEKISSSRIRELISGGKISEANAMLGKNYSFALPVEYGNKIGRTINFPTINQYLSGNVIMPKFGVYKSEASFQGKTYRGLTNIGVKPTVTDKNIPIAETYIKDFSGDLYGETVEVSLIDFIRPERKFSGIEELKKQIEIDIEKL